MLNVKQRRTNSNANSNVTKLIFLSALLLAAFLSAINALQASSNLKDQEESNPSLSRQGPRITGRYVEWLHQDPDDLDVRIALNMQDETAKQANKGKSAPIMLSEVRRIDKADEGRLPHAVLLESGSHIKFIIKSKGPFGFGYRIYTGAEMIAKELYQLKTEPSNEFSESHLLRYQDAEKTIQIDNFKTMGIVDPKEKNKNMFCTIESWAVNDYVKDGKIYKVKTGPQRENASVQSKIQVEANVVGVGIHKGEDSTAKFGSGLTKINTTLPPEAKDAEGLPLKRNIIRLMLFAFASESDKKAFYDSYKDINVDDF